MRGVISAHCRCSTRVSGAVSGGRYSESIKRTSDWQWNRSLSGKKTVGRMNVQVEMRSQVKENALVVPLLLGEKENNYFFMADCKIGK